LVRELDLSLQRATLTCVLGCNGAGKSLTLHTLAGLRDTAAGEIRLENRTLSSWPRKLLAQRLGLLPQHTEDPFPSTVMEAVLVGRHPHIGFWDWESDADRALASAALTAVGLQGLDTRDIATLSGGERRRVAIAAILTQDPDVLLLDEPINHLDPHHQIDVLRLFRRKVDGGRAVLMSLHDVGLAARFADQCLLLFGNGEWLSGATHEVLTEDTITRLYGVPVRELVWEGGRTFVAE
jgi:iron complex transport system ATP-binding protein